MTKDEKGLAFFYEITGFFWKFSGCKAMKAAPENIFESGKQHAFLHSFPNAQDSPQEGNQ